MKASGGAPLVALRVAAAILGSYGLALLWAAACAAALPLPRAEATLAGLLVGLLVPLGAAIWSFAARRARWVLGGLALAAVPPLGALWWTAT